MNRDRLAQVDTVLFDVMGTVVDDGGSVRRQASAVLRREGVRPEDAERAVHRWRERVGAAMAAVVAGSAPWRCHGALWAEALSQVVQAGELPQLGAGATRELETVIRRLEPWADSAAALAALREGFTVVALSNADLVELAEMSHHAGLAWHAVVSGQSARAYKPDPRVYRAALELLGLDPSRGMLVAAHPWDLRAAAEHGLGTAYIARPGAEPPAATDSFDVHAGDLTELATLLSAGTAGRRGEP